jgi:hypothetical protein
MAEEIWSKTDMVTIILVCVLCLPSVIFMKLIWINTLISIQTIKKVVKSKNILSSPALTMDRI